MGFYSVAVDIQMFPCLSLLKYLHISLFFCPSTKNNSLYSACLRTLILSKKLDVKGRPASFKIGVNSRREFNEKTLVICHIGYNTINFFRFLPYSYPVLQTIE
jgi:hypothetical protein